MTYRTHTDFLSQRETATPVNDRLRIFVQEYLAYRDRRQQPLKLLDVGCGKTPVLFDFKANEDFYHGVDFYPAPSVALDAYTSLDLNSTSLRTRLSTQFDVVFCGEVIEHLFSPDALLEDIRELMHDTSILILSTPNLGYYVNRVLLALGISPLFLENSSQAKLGRRFRRLGQGNPTEGHVRLFTTGALRDILELHGFSIQKHVPTTVWDFPLDRLVGRLSTALAPISVVVARRGSPRTHSLPR